MMNTKTESPTGVPVQRMVRRWRVGGIAMVPVEVFVTVEAASEQEAIAKADQLPIHEIRQGIVGNSADECCVHDFRAGTVKEAPNDQALAQPGQKETL